MSDDPHRLRRFVEAQDRAGIYGRALDELRAGRKAGHWMWFVFPQVSGLGHSPTARAYAIGSSGEAKAYLDHPVLGPRLRECARALLGHTGETAEQILGDVDAIKLRSSMTLFARAAPGEAIFQEVLDRYFGGSRDGATEEFLGGDGEALPADCSLRAARAADAAPLSQLVDDAYGHYVERLGGEPGPMRDDYAEVIRERDVRLVESEGGIIAAIVLGVGAEGFTIENVAVHPSRQGEGIGRALLELAEGEGRRAGHDAVHLYTHEKMVENQTLYARLGYVEYDRRSEAGFTRVFMRKPLT